MSTFGCDAGAAGERVEGDTLAEEDFANGTADGGDMGYGFEGGAFGVVQFYSETGVSARVRYDRLGRRRVGKRA